LYLHSPTLPWIPTTTNAFSSVFCSTTHAPIGAMTFHPIDRALSWKLTRTFSSLCFLSCLLRALRAPLPWVLLRLYATTNAPNGALTTSMFLCAMLVLLLCTIIVIHEVCPQRYRRWMCLCCVLVHLRLLLVRHAATVVGTMRALCMHLYSNGTCMPNALTGTAMRGKQYTLLLIHTCMIGYLITSIEGCL
jgi:hypothetical protein